MSAIPNRISARGLQDLLKLIFPGNQGIFILPFKNGALFGRKLPTILHRATNLLLCARADVISTAKQSSNVDDFLPTPETPLQVCQRLRRLSFAQRPRKRFSQRLLFVEVFL